MSAAYILKCRLPGETTKWTGWVEVNRAEDQEPLVGPGQEASAENPKAQFAIFHRGSIVSWWQGGKSIMAQSRAAPPPEVHMTEEQEGHRYHLYSFVGPQGQLVAECVAHDAETAWRMLRGAVRVAIEDDGTLLGETGWDLTKLKINEGAAVALRSNFWITIDTRNAPGLKGGATKTS